MAKAGILRLSVIVAAVFMASLLVLALTGLADAASSSEAPGAPGKKAVWTAADKDGFGTSTTTTSKVWYTLNDGKLTEVYYPDLGTPSVRDLQFVVSDGKTFAELETKATTHKVRLVDDRALEYRQINTDRDGKYRITKTYVTDPARSTVLVDVTFESLTGKPYRLYALYDPSLNNGGDNDTATSKDGQLLASDGKVASALIGSPEFGPSSSGYLGTSDGWTDLKNDYKMDWNFRSASTPGNVVQTAKTALTGLSGDRRLTLALGFGATRSGALSTARGSLTGGFQKAQAGYRAGWHGYLGSLKEAPASVDTSLQRTTYDVSAMTLAAHEDKTYRGAYVASPSMPWVWGTTSQETGDILDSRGPDETSGAYHLVWSRDLYQIATALMAAGDRAGANRALTYLFERQQKPDGSFPQNSTVDGSEHWENVQLDQVAFPLVMAWQLGRKDGATYRDHIKPAADYIVDHGPATPQERWENQGGWSPATIASEIAGLVCAAKIARLNGDEASATTYMSKADNWQRNIEEWTVTTNGPLADHPYYLRITKSPGDDPADSDVPPNPNAPTTYSIGDSGPSTIDQRLVVDTSYLELVRLGVKPADDPAIVRTLNVVDSKAIVGPFPTPPNEPQKRGLRVDTPNGTFWHRFNFDGYGETRDGGPWDIGYPSCDTLPRPCLQSQRTIGRAWPIFAGERGEYELAAGGSGAADSASERLASIAKTGNAGYMLPEQVWDDFPPSGRSGFPKGEGTLSATPLAWTHAQYVRLAWSIQVGHPVEQPRVVSCRYAGRCAR
ncbi:MAG TPA: glycoside hydrolase family 15 protein [Rubrobacter sp.]|nr:glycoside hydrolase family 15 protein [Rubrobacter sp.]